MNIIDLNAQVKAGEVGWVLGLGKALIKDESLELAFYNNVGGEANNPLHHHNLSTERLLVIKGGLLLEIEGQPQPVGAMEMVCLPPGTAHRIISYQEGTIALNLRNSRMGAVGHLPEDR
jgi:mannose-6-phosphate isomerase-like protein (cupin superfamily)